MYILSNFKILTGWAQWFSPAIPETWKVDNGSMAVQGQPEQKVSESPPISTNKLGVGVHIYDPSTAGKMAGGSWPEAISRQNYKILSEK
jgi:hypothetical protein